MYIIYDIIFFVSEGYNSMDQRQLEIADNLKTVNEKISRAAERCSAGEVTLLAATKTVPAEDIAFAAGLGLRYAGENRAQEFRDKYETLHGLLDYQFIGSIQSNKLKYLVGKATLIQSVGTIETAEQISGMAGKLGITQDVLLEINSGGEDSKSGFLPDAAEEAIAECIEMPNIRVRGIMTIGPVGVAMSELRKSFELTHKLYVDKFIKMSHNIKGAVLSMGMSDSYEAAIEEGANMVRVGSAIFGHRIY